MAVSHIASTFGATSPGGNTTNVTVPATATTGRLILLLVYYNVSGVTLSTSTSGWTAMTSVSNSSLTLNGQTARPFYKVATGTDAGSTVTLNSTASNGQFSSSWHIYSGQDATTPVVATNSTGTGTMSTTTLTVNGVTMGANGGMLFAYYTSNQSSGYTTGTMTERLDTTSAALGSADETVATGATGTRTITAGASASAYNTIGIGINTASATATLTQSTFRGRNDDGNETTATWKATAGTDWTQAVDTNFRVRFNIADSVAAATQNTAFVLRYSLNSGAYTAVSASSSVVRAFASANVADGAATTEQLAGAGTFNSGTIDEVDGSATGFTAATSTGQDTEVEYSVQIRGVDVANGDTINLRVYDNAGVALNGGYTDTPIITVSKPATSLIYDHIPPIHRLLRSM